MVRAKEQMQRAGDQDCHTKRSTGLACIFISFGVVSVRTWRVVFPLLQHYPTPHTGVIAMSDWSKAHAMPSREFPMVRCNLSSHGPGAIREGMSVWAMLPYLVIHLVLGSVTKHDKGMEKTGLTQLTQAPYHDRASSVQNPANEAPSIRAKQKVQARG